MDVYDFKFPCVNTNKPVDWRRYPDGHPYADELQGDMYVKALKLLGSAARVIPRLGAFR